jgi:hypothetical protein
MRCDVLDGMGWNGMGWDGFELASQPASQPANPRRMLFGRMFYQLVYQLEGRGHRESWDDKRLKVPQ